MADAGVVAVFQDPTQAAAAVRALRDAGFADVAVVGERAFGTAYLGTRAAAAASLLSLQIQATKARSACCAPTCCGA